MDWEEHKTFYNESFYTKKCHTVVDGVVGVGDSSPLLNGIFRTTGIPASIIDCGCGGGALLASIRRLYPDMELYGFDLAPFAIDHAPVEVQESVEVLDCATEPIPFPDNHFELCIAMDFYEHQHDDYIRTVLEETARVTAKYIFIRQPFIHFEVPFAERLDLIVSFNHLAHIDRLALIDNVPEIISSLPDPNCPYHPQERGRAYFASFFANVGFEEISLDEEFYIMPNLGHCCSFTTMLLQRKSLL